MIFQKDFHYPPQGSRLLSLTLILENYYPSSRRNQERKEIKGIFLCAHKYFRISEYHSVNVTLFSHLSLDSRHEFVVRLSERILDDIITLSKVPS